MASSNSGRGLDRDRIACAGFACLAIFAFAFAVIRARVQSVTGDEASSFLVFGGGPTSIQWYPAAANHLLNTLISKLAITLFGLSPTTLRAGAIAGGAIFIGSAFWICRMLTREWTLRFALFACLVFNPYVFDYFAVGRGYGLGLGFLLFAIAFAAWSHLERCYLLGCAIASASLGLSFTANFAFAFADVSVMLLIVAWMIGSLRPPRKEMLKFAVAAFVPGFAVVALLPSSMILHWPKGALVQGTNSVADLVRQMTEATLDGVNANIVNPWLMTIALAIQPYLIPAFWIAGALQLAAVAIGARKFTRPENQWRVGVIAVSGGAAVLALVLHWAALQSFGLLIPVNRASVFFAPLVTLPIAAAASIAVVSRIGEWVRRAVIFMLCTMAVYFVGCLRVSYFHEWGYIAEAREAYYVAAFYNHTRCARNVYANWRYDSALEFYRLYSPAESFTSFVPKEHPEGHQLYVLNLEDDRNLIDSLRLVEVYHGQTTKTAVFLSPEIAAATDRTCDAAKLP